jgi:type IV secretion system protein VirD4
VLKWPKDRLFSAVCKLGRSRIAMSASRVVWGQIVVVFAIALLAVWMATQWIAWRLGFQAQLGAPRFSLAGLPVYPPPAFF